MDGTLKSIKENFHFQLNGWKDWGKNDRRVFLWHERKRLEFQISRRTLYFTSWDNVEGIKNYIADKCKVNKSALAPGENTPVKISGSNIEFITGTNDNYFELKRKREYTVLADDFTRFYNDLKNTGILAKFIELTPLVGQKKMDLKVIRNLGAMRGKTHKTTKSALHCCRKTERKNSRN